MELKIEWSIGFDDRYTFFIDSQTLVYISGQYVCFYNEENGSQYLPLPSYAATKLAVHPSDNVFALAETEKQNPFIYLYNYPSMENFGIIKDFTQLDVLRLSFSSSDYLAIVSGLPDFSLTLWNFKSQKHLCSKALDFQSIDDLSVSPVNWKNIVITSEHRIYIYNVEHCGSLFLVKDKFIKLPPVDKLWEGHLNAIIPDSRVTIAKSSSRNISYDFELPPSAKADVSCKNFKEFLESQDIEMRCICVSHAWSGNGDLYFGCEDGQLIKLDMEHLVFKVILSTNKNESKYMRTETPTIRNNDINLAGNMKVMCFAKEGIYMAGEDGIVRLAKSSENEITDDIQDIHQIKEIISKMNFNYNYTKLAVISPHGIIDVITINEAEESCKSLYNIEYGSFVGIGVLPCCKHIATLRRNGRLQIWNMENKISVSSIVLSPATSMDISPFYNILAVGLNNGVLEIYDVGDVVQPRKIHEVKIHNSPISKIRFGKTGQVLITGSNDGYVVILSGNATDRFNVLGTTNFEGIFMDLCVFQNPTADEIAQVVISSQTQQDIVGANRLAYFEISPSIINDPANYYENINGTFDDECIRKMSLTFESPCFGCVLGVQPPNEKSPVLYAVDVDSRCLCQYQIPSSTPKKAGNKASRLRPVHIYKDLKHEDPQVSLNLSINNRFIMTYGKEGVIRVIDIKDDNNWNKVSAHQVSSNGVIESLFSYDSNFIYSCGEDNTFSCHNIILPADVQDSNEKDYSNMISKIGSKIIRQNNEISSIRDIPSSDVLTNKSFTGKSKNDSSDFQIIYFNNDTKTWSEKRVFDLQEQEDQQYLELQNSIKDGIANIRTTIQLMLDENENLSDLEKIDRQEFELDLEMKKKIHSEIDSEIKTVIDKIEYNNLSKQFVLDVIKKECWDQMTVKGRSLCAFTSNIEVTNYPLKDRPLSVINQVEMVVKRRMIEIEDGNDRKIYSEHLQKNSMNIEDGDENEDEEIRESTNLSSHDLRDYEKFDKIAPNVKYLYPQMDLESREQKIYQVILIKDIIYQMKIQFNKEFTEVFQKKEQEINRIKEKNARIVKILNDIDMPHLIQPDPELSSLEKPEKLLIVEDNEIKVERYLTDEQRRKLEEDRLAEEERKRKEKLDNWRERGLEDMMGGVLEVKREDELKKDIPKPAFLIAMKPQEEWTDEEKKIFEEYDKKVKELNDEREKYKKQLEAEYKKLSGIIDDAKSAFDENLLNLFNRQISVQMAIYQEEVKILRLQWSLLIDEELVSRKREIHELKIENQSEIKAVKSIILTAKNVLEISQDAYETMMAEEKVMDKAFRREFADVHGSVFEYISKLYKKRPKNRLLGTQFIPSSQMPNYAKHNPYSARPGSEKQKQFQMEVLKNAIKDLDKQDTNDSVDIMLYERLCKSRKKRIMKEFEIKQMALEMAEMQAFYQKRLEEEKGLENNDLHLDRLMETLDVYRYQYQTNKELQLVIKQGQLEVEAVIGFIHDFTESVFLHRSTIEDLNKEIKELGHAKVKHMTKAKNSKKKFIHLEWELRRMLMEYEDLVRKMREIQCFKITKEIQRYLATNDYDGLINAEIQKMEQTINHLKTFQTKNIDQKKTRHKYINNNKLIKIKNENDDIAIQFTELNVQVNERKHISSGFPGDNVGQKNVEMRYQKILQRQHLVDLAKSQAREVAVLRSEVERLRMRTFPALIQHKG